MQRQDLEKRITSKFYYSFRTWYRVIGCFIAKQPIFLAFFHIPIDKLGGRGIIRLNHEKGGDDMRKRAMAAACLLGASMVAMSSCSGYVLTVPQLRGGDLLAKPASTVERLTWEEKQEGNYVSFLEKLDGFAGRFASTVYHSYQTSVGAGDNFCVSPVSMFAGLSLAAECAGGNTRVEILDALGVSYEELSSQSMNLYRSLNVAHEGGGIVIGNQKTGELQFGNSIWLQKGFAVKQACVDSLAENFG